MNYFQGKKIWITGASSGIGEGFVRHLSTIDCQLILSSRRKEELERVKSENQGAKASFDIEVLDLADSGQIEIVSNKVIEKYNGVDIVIHCGGISQRDRVVDTSMDVQRRLVEVNYFGTIDVTKRTLPKMVENKFGHQVVVTSVTGIISSPLRSGYAASKHALHGYFDALRAEHHADNIAVTLLCPGYIKTNISLNALKGNGQKQNKMDNAQANGMTVDELIPICLKAVSKRKEEIYIGGFKEVAGVYLKRFFPKIFSRAVRKLAVT
ncbi:SDR family NAD(P)-dependent oxidoreductase [Reichenbachiella versicolor]|uniref:SDR family NAD(P)-dependent oxidoreductase n=1 Tax=Reichenbachiella versicolor TaxID=1821036 RepID=UPI000D6E5A68|nr:SDR family NAD(P)-dependent oxidoreductase [Reichenbachiella versicolor]